MDLQLGDVRDTRTALELVAFAYGEGRLPLDEARIDARKIGAHISATEDLRRRPDLRAEFRQLLHILRIVETSACEDERTA